MAAGRRRASLAELGLVAPSQPLASLPVTGLATDSRNSAPGVLFAALPGAQIHGARFAADALAAGAAAVLTDAEGAGLIGACGAPVLVDPEPRRALARAAAAWFGAQPETMVAVTGTNGKTSVASFCRQIWAHLGHRAAALGTLGLEGVADRSRSGAALTTPDPLALHRLLADLAAAGVSHAAMEASSHGLDQHRLDGVRLSAAAFTNVSRDHLDYHGNDDAYMAAKLALFDRVLPVGATAVINLDDPTAALMQLVAVGRGQRIVSVGCAPKADLQLLDAVHRPQGQDIQYSHAGRRYITRLPLIGDFQAANVLMAAALAIATGAMPERVFAVLPKLAGVRGRMEYIGSRPEGGAVYVDYAHTPDALGTALRALRPHVDGRLTCVFGAGGDRDPGKRPLMGAAAAAAADAVIVTDDNPRSEEPATIRRAVLAEAPEAVEIGDRAEAIAAGIAGLGPDDALIIAGKGHESGQIRGDTVLPFDDAAIARDALAEDAAGRRVTGSALRGAGV
ncbi:MAG: UDP-N-acetylmuramoyl-L-alanyl-D-glutamate--2,6-diaminopimelate ligase [Pseudomonadota bacterium]